MKRDERQAQAERDRVRGLAGFNLSREETQTTVWQRFHAAVNEELDILRRQNDDPMNIVDTTVLRGQIQLLKRIQARTREVGPGSRQSEPLGPESASALHGQGIPLR